MLHLLIPNLHYEFRKKGNLFMSTYRTRNVEGRNSLNMYEKLLEQ